MALIELEGELSWVKAVTPDEYEGKRNWSACTTLNPDALQMIMELKAEGVKNVLKKDDQNRWYIKVSRRDGIYKGDKMTKVLNPPVVTDAEGNIIDGDTVGNGSKGILKIDVYEHPVKGGTKAKAMRLESIKITELKKRGE